MDESVQRGSAASSFKQGTSVPDCSPKIRTDFAKVARALWPRKTAAELAFRAGVSERAAKFWLSGERDPSHDALMVILDKISGRRRA